MSGRALPLVSTPTRGLPLPDRPSQMRWWVLAAATLTSVLLYLDRICVSIAAGSIRAEFGATQEQMGWFLGAFFWSYALFQVPSGWLGTRFGIRTMLPLYIVGWSLCTAWVGLATTFFGVIAARVFCGLTQSGAYPCAARAVRDWMPISQRGTASSIVAFGGRIGGAIAPLLTGSLMLYVALQQSSPAFIAREIRDPAVIAKTLTPNLSDPSSSWTTLLATSAAAQQPPATDPPTAEEMARWLNAIDLRASLSQQALPTDCPPQIAARLADSKSDPAVANRQLWELIFPDAVHKLETRGWRQVMVAYGLMGLLVAGFFWFIFRETPARHPWCNQAEKQLIGGHQAQQATPSEQATTPFPWRGLLTDTGLWGNCVMQFGTNVGWVFLITWLPRYLEDVHKVPVLQRSVMASVPLFAGMIGMLLGGPWTDWWTRTYGLRWGRRGPVLISRVLAAIGFGLALLVSTGFFGPLGTMAPAWIAVAGMAFVAIATDVGVAAVWAYAQDVGGEHTAAVLGWANMWGNLGAAIAPVVASSILGQTPSLAAWNLLFVCCGLAFLISGAGGALMDSSRPLRGSTTG